MSGEGMADLRAAAESLTGNARAVVEAVMAGDLREAHRLARVGEFATPDPITINIVGSPTAEDIAKMTGALTDAVNNAEAERVKPRLIVDTTGYDAAVEDLIDEWERTRGRWSRITAMTESKFFRGFLLGLVTGAAVCTLVLLVACGTAADRVPAPDGAIPWTFAENAEDVTFDFSRDNLVISSSTGVESVTVPLPIECVGDAAPVCAQILRYAEMAREASK